MENLLGIDTSLFCQFCGENKLLNGNLNKLGILGNKEYYACRQCGMQFSVDLERIKINKDENSISIKIK